MAADSPEFEISGEDMGSVQCEPQVAMSTYIAVQGSQMHSYGKQNAGNRNMDIEKGNLDKMIVNDEMFGSIKTEIALTKALRRQNSLQPAGEPVHPFVNHILMLLKLDSKDKQAMERAHETPSNRWKKYRRPGVFDSRQIVLLFSIMSSMGTLVLIYLTLRVRQAGEGLVLM